MKAAVRSADGVQVHYEVHGNGAPALVFVHGWSCDRGYWRGQVGHFADRYQVVTIDLAGHGESGLGRQSWTMPAFGADVAAVVEQLGLRETVLVGHSMGGDVIVEATLRLPDRVAGLVWVDTYRTLDETDSAGPPENFFTPFREDFVTATRDFVRRMFTPGSDAELAEWVAADMSAAPPEVALDAMRHALTAEHGTIAALRDVTAPVVAINPDWRPTDVDALARHGVRAVLVSGVGHFVMMEDPAAFNRVLGETIDEFTASQGSGRD